MDYSALFSRLTMSPSKVHRAHSREKFVKNKKKNGFSLVEVLVVVGIIGLLVALVGPSALQQFQASKSKTAEIQIGNIKNALEIFLLDIGRYPTAAEGLDMLVSNPSGIPGWNGPYLKDGLVPLDPWGRAYNLRVDENSVLRVESYGADGLPGGEGNNRDIVS